MSAARERYGPPRTPAEQTLRYLEQSKISQVGATLRQQGVTQSAGQGQATPALAHANNGSHGNDVRKDLGVAQGQRPALSPDDRNRQVATRTDVAGAGKKMQEANVTGGQSVSAAERFKPAQTPTQTQARTQSRSR